MSKLSFCRICLVSNLKVYCITNTPYQEIYEKLTSLTLCMRGRSEQVCYVCLSVLGHSQQLALSARRTEKVLTQLVNQGMQISQDTVTALKRNCITKLTCTPLQTLNISDSNIPIPIKTEIKKEIDEEYIVETGQEHSNCFNISYESDFGDNEDKFSFDQPGNRVDNHIDNHTNNDLNSSFNENDHCNFHNIDQTDNFNNYDQSELSNFRQSEHKFGNIDPGKRVIDQAGYFRNYGPSNITENDQVNYNNNISSSNDKNIPQYMTYIHEDVLENSNMDEIKEEMVFDNEITVSLFNNEFVELNEKMDYGMADRKLSVSECDSRLEQSIYSKEASVKKESCHEIDNVSADIEFCDEKPNNQLENEKSKRYEVEVADENGEVRVRHACPHCQKSYTHRCHLLRHIRLHREGSPSKNRDFVCDYCDKAFTQKSALEKHLSVHTGFRKYSCDHCPTKCVQKVDMERHMRTHTGAKPYQCGICKLYFSRKVNMLLHYQTHLDKKPFLCDVCHMAFSRKYDLNRHCKRKHSGEKPYGCDICDFRSVNASYVKTHFVNMHVKARGEKPYVCCVCNAGFSSEGYMNLHMSRKHSEVKM